MNYIVFESPIGVLTAICDENRLLEINFGKNKEVENKNNENDFCLEVKKQLNEYFTGKRKTFSVTIALNMTDFQTRVLNELIKIPYGETVSYFQIAEKLGKPGAARAVGTACGKNPIPIIIPCHRVIGSNKKLTGYTGGLSKKQYLLKLEQNNKNY